MKMVSMVIVQPKENTVDDIVNLVNESRKEGIPGSMFTI
jgi:hypothetical protein